MLKAHEPQIRAHLGTAAYFWAVFVTYSVIRHNTLNPKGLQVRSRGLGLGFWRERSPSKSCLRPERVVPRLLVTVA